MEEPLEKPYPEYEVDNRLKQGPLQERQKTDVNFLYAFFVALAGFFIFMIASMALKNKRALSPVFDSNGRACGYHPDTKDYPYVYIAFVHPRDLLFDRRVCVKACPSTSNKEIQCKETRNTVNCEDIANFQYDTQVFQDRYCIPQVASDIIQKVEEKVKSVLDAMFQDVANNFQVIILIILIAFTISFTCIVLLRYCAGVVLWFLIFAYMAFLVILGILFMSIKKNFEEGNGFYTFFNILGWTFFSIFGVSLLLTILCFKRISFLIGVLKAAAVFIQDNFWSVLIPPLFSSLQIVFFVIFVTSQIAFKSTGEPKQYTASTETNFGSTMGYTQFSGAQNFAQKLQWIFYYWVNFFIVHISQFILAGAVCIWYFTKRQNANPVIDSLKNVFQYHSGSAALGSLIFGIFTVIRTIIGQKDEAGCCNCMACFYRCCVMLLCKSCHEFLSFIGKHAYVEISLTGKSLIPACWDGFKVITRNAVRFSISSGMFGLFKTLGFLSITLMTTILSILMIQSTGLSNTIEYKFIFFIFSFVIGWIISDLYMEVLSNVGSTIIHCYIIDEELHKDSEPGFSPDALKRIMDENDKTKTLV